MPEFEHQSSSNYVSISAALDAGFDNEAPITKVVNLEPMSSDSEDETETTGTPHRISEVPSVSDLCSEIKCGADTSESKSCTFTDIGNTSLPVCDSPVQIRDSDIDSHPVMTILISSEESGDGSNSRDKQPKYSPEDSCKAVTLPASSCPVSEEKVFGGLLRKYLTEEPLPQLNRASTGLLASQHTTVLPVAFIQQNQTKRSRARSKKLHECTVCCRLFSRSENLKRHLTVHTGERNYKCPLCEKTFPTPKSLHQHKMVHTDARSFPCELCEKMFWYKSQLVEHIRSHTGMKPYKCSECEAAFTSSQTLKVHKRTHTGERPYACEICDKSFSTSTGRSNHRKTHSGEKNYLCPVCKQWFARKPNLQCHLII